ncbi:MAG TPA: coenzyme F420 hydrogenase [Ignisphaera aggregans]|uniref:Coenzyme F420 hydrogenase n=1 Tax=Ignisphaera aggregans TaxID=334771 RepID=A0A833DUR1_9CREN|nr:coenzyme F420 hydrogenase [Ignisphaera aggregans]
MAMSTESKSVRQLERICGEAKLVAVHDGSRIVDAYFLALNPVRGFEKLVLGKSPLFVLEAVKRICGVCHAAQAIASAEAFEDAMGIVPPPNGRTLREVIGLINRVQSHLFHLILILRDIVRIEALNSLMVECIRLLNEVNEVMMRIGGAPTHPTNISIGGVAKIPTEASLKESMRKVNEIRKRFRSLQEDVMSSESDFEKLSMLRKYGLPDGVQPIASHPFYGDRYSIDVECVNVVRYEEYRDIAIDVEHRPTSMIALYNKQVVEVGPRARLELFREYADRSLLSLQQARFVEVDLALQRISELLGRVNTTAPAKTVGIVRGPGKGVGVFEAPRGVLIHYVELDGEGRVKSYRIVVPTMFNIPVIERTLRGLPLELADVVPRLFDPCIPCSTHLVKVGA